MSHFSVLVVGPDPEAQLAPYHEFECTGVDDQFVQTLDITDEARKDYADSKTSQTFTKWAMDWYGYELVSPMDYPDKSKAHKYGYVRAYSDGSVKVFKRTNPNRKWDWYVLGGRFRGFFKLKTNGSVGTLGGPGVFGNEPDHDADQALKRDIDFAGMRDNAASIAAACWDMFSELIGTDDSTRPWEEFRDEERLGDMGARRAAYWAQPGLMKLQAARTRQDLNEEQRGLLVWLDYDAYNVPRDVFIERARNASGSTFAVVKEGVWHERGGMGWWGAVHDEKDTDTWSGEFWKLMDTIPEDTLLSVYDAHI